MIALHQNIFGILDHCLFFRTPLPRLFSPFPPASCRVLFHKVNRLDQFLYL